MVVSCSLILIILGFYCLREAFTNNSASVLALLGLVGALFIVVGIGGIIRATKGFGKPEDGGKLCS